MTWAKRSKRPLKKAQTLGLQAVLHAGEVGAKVGELHVFDSELILQQACIVPPNIGCVVPSAVFKDHDLDRVLVDRILVIPFQPDLVRGREDMSAPVPHANKRDLCVEGRCFCCLALQVWL